MYTLVKNCMHLWWSIKQALVESILTLHVPVKTLYLSQNKWNHKCLQLFYFHIFLMYLLLTLLRRIIYSTTPVDKITYQFSTSRVCMESLFLSVWKRQTCCNEQNRSKHTCHHTITDKFVINSAYDLLEHLVLYK